MSSLHRLPLPTGSSLPPPTVAVTSLSRLLPAPSAPPCPVDPVALRRPRSPPADPRSQHSPPSSSSSHFTHHRRSGCMTLDPNTPFSSSHFPISQHSPALDLRPQPPPVAATPLLSSPPPSKLPPAPNPYAAVDTTSIQLQPLDTCHQLLHRLLSRLPTQTAPPPATPQYGSSLTLGISHHRHSSQPREMHITVNIFSAAPLCTLSEPATAFHPPMCFG